MAELDHWHPVLESRALGRAAVTGVKLCGEEIALFRTDEGVGAVRDRCPHRGMRLSLGSVREERLVCPYHGWSYARDGAGESPGTPKLRACVERYDTVERHGLVWLKRAGAAAAFPRYGAEENHHVATVRHVFEAPLELCLDNFIEVEHTPTTHAFLGYPLDRMHEVETRVEVTDESVRVVNVGPQKPIPRLVELLFGIKSGDRFTDDWTTYFSPVYTVYDHWWADPATGEPRPDHLLSAVFLNPIDAGATEVWTIAHGNRPPWARYGLGYLTRPLARALVDLEIRRDKRMVESLADKSTALRGNRLGRFDAALGEARKRIERIYRGRTTAESETAATVGEKR